MDLGPVEALAEDDETRLVAVLDPGRPDHLETIRVAPVLALDLESDNFHAYREKTCLLQIATPEVDFFFDPLPSGLPAVLADELARSDRPVVLHAADNDVRALARDFELRLGRIFDTALAARLLGLPGLGLKTLLEGELGVVVDKGEQRSDWSRRPLDAEQLRYARDDVRWLTRLHRIMAHRLDDTGRRAWHDEECERLRWQAPSPKRFDPESWRRVKPAKGLGPRGRAVMAALWRWREGEASRRDVPAFRVARGDVMARVAKVADARGAKALEDLDGFTFLPPSLDREGLRQAIREGLAAPDPGPRAPRRSPEHGGRGPLDPEAKARRDRLRALRDRRAEELGIDPGFLLANQVADRLAREAPLDVEALAELEGLGRWRMEVLGEEMLNAVCL